MNISACRSSLASLTRVLRYAFSDHHAPKPTKLDKVDKKIVWFNVKNVYGAFERVPGFVGESLMRAIKRSQTSGFDADCDGGDMVYAQHERPVDPMSQGVFCSSCMVTIDQPWYNRLSQEVGAPNQDEQHIIDTTQVPHARTRLACCIPVQGWMNEMTLRVVENDEPDES